MLGEGIEKTIIAYDDHEFTDTSATFIAYPNNIIISGITFKVRLFIYTLFIFSILLIINYQ